MSIAAVGVVRRRCGVGLGQTPLWSVTSIASSSRSSSRLQSRPGRLLPFSPQPRAAFHASARHSNEQASKSSALTPNASAKELSPTASANPPLSIAKRLTSLFALKEASGDTGTSSIGKLIELAKPEKKQLGIGIGLVSTFALPLGHSGVLHHER